VQFIAADQTSGPWDLVVIGSGFGSLFFLHSYLERNPTKKVLMLEWGRHNTTDWQLEHNTNSDIAPLSTFSNESPKTWNFNIGLGGGTNCWSGMTPRMHPNDFRLRSLYGRGMDWPISYDDLMEDYDWAERIMLISGPPDMGKMFPGAGNYPQRPHKMSSPDLILKAANPDVFFSAPCAKLSESVPGRSACCSNGSCSLCPMKAKFYGIDNMTFVFDNPAVSICTGARVRHIHAEGDTAKSVVFQSGGREYTVAGDLIVLGANGIHAPFILQQSGILDGEPGAYLGEKMLALVEIYLDGLEHFDGGTSTTAVDLRYVDGPHRAEGGANLYWSENSFQWSGLRLDPPNRFREVLPVAMTVEDELLRDNAVVDTGGDLPKVVHAGFSDYAMKGLDRAVSKVPEVFGALPIEDVQFRRIEPTTDHLQGSLRMGTDPETSVVDPDQHHHRVRNLVVVGTSVFPTTSWANPSLTCAAMSLRLGKRI